MFHDTQWIDIKVESIALIYKEVSQVNKLV